MAVNSDLVKLIESSPDTVITLITGEKIVIRESTEEVISLIVRFRRTILTAEPLGAGIAPSHLGYCDKRSGLLHVIEGR
jgi:flagellar protein FlbD